jgi:hypothetical protein
MLDETPTHAAVHIAIPFARPVSLVTSTNWQGTGVAPDVPVPEAEARGTACAMALRHVPDPGHAPPPRRDEAREALVRLGGAVTGSPARPPGGPGSTRRPGRCGSPG